MNLLLYFCGIELQEGIIIKLINHFLPILYFCIYNPVWLHEKLINITDQLWATKLCLS